MAAPQDDVRLFVRYFQSLTHGSYGVGKAFLKATKAEPTSIERVFADAGKSAFHAFHAVKKRISSTHTYRDHRPLKIAFSNLSKEPLEYQRAFAELLGKSMEGVASGPVERGEGNSSRKRKLSRM